MLISLTGPSGVGKGYIKERILEAFQGITELTWTTTRPLRIGESTRSNRKNVTQTTFNSLNRVGSLVGVQSLHGHLYGLERSQLDRCRESLCLTETHIDNIAVMAGLVEDFLPIALITTDITFLRERLVHYRRETEDQNIESRIQAAEREVVNIKKDQQFALVVEVSGETEAQVARKVLAFLKDKIKRTKGDRT